MPAAGDRLTARVIELNSFLTSTGGALFSWTADADVLHGRAPFEFRLQRAPIANAVDVAAMMEDEVLAVTASPAAAAAPERPHARRDTVCSVS